MSNFETLTHPELFDQIPFVGGTLRNSLEEQGQAVLAEDTPSNLKLTIGIRTLNEAGPLEQLLQTIDQQEGSGDTQVIVVDNESTDNTVEVAKSYGATVLPIARSDFNYPRSMNICLEAADNQLVFLTVGHAMLASTVALEGAKRRFARDESVTGVFARPLPSPTASATENMLAVANIMFNTKMRETKKATMGIMGSTNAIFHRGVWEELGKFDEQLGMGGEDTQMAARMIAAGYKIIEDPILAVHHSHGLGPVNYVRQVMAWTQMAKGKESPFDVDAIRRRRPDLRFD